MTELKAAEQQLRDERDLVNATLDLAGVLIMVRDAESRIVRFNRQCEQLSGYDEAEVIGRRYAFLVPPSELEAVSSKLERVARDKVVEQDNHWLTRHGEERLIR